MAIQKTIKIQVDNNFKEATKDLDGLNEGLNETAEASEDLADSSQEATSNLAGMSPMLSTAGAAFGKFKKGIMAVRAGFFTLRGAIIASGIGALVLAVIAVTQAFKGSEEGQNKFSKIMYGIGVVMDNILDVLADLGEAIIYAFENPIETIKSFGKAIIDNIVNRFMGMLELIPAIGSAISELFSGNFSKAGRIATNAMGKVVYGIENVVEKTEALIIAGEKLLAQQREELRIAGEISDARAKADILERTLLVDRARLQTDIAKLKLKSREEETVSAKDRKKALIEAQAIEDKLLKRELEVAQLRFDSVKRENTLARSTKEAKNAEAQAEADLFNITARRTDAQRSTQRELNRVNKEIAADAKARLKVETAAKEYFVEFTRRTTNEEITILTKAAKAKYDLQIKAGQDLIKLYDAQDKLVQDLQEKGYEKDLALLVKLQEDRLAIAGDDEGLQKAVIENFNKAKEDLEKEHQEKLGKIDEDANKKIADNAEKLRLKKLAAKDEELDVAKQGVEAIQALGDMVFAHKLAQVEKGSKEEEKLAKKQFNFNKAMQLGGAVIDAGKAVIASLASAPLAIGVVPNPIGIASLAAVGVTSALNIAKIAAAKFESPGGPPDTTVPSLGGGAPPQFNVVGDSGINQLANVNQQPTQAYVVSGDVTTAQSLDRNRVQNATI
jgi:hypothetical protein